MKRAYLANGTLAAQAATKDNVLVLDSATWTYLSNLLGTDYCYLVVGRKEVVKVQGLEAPNIALVVRGLEGTCRSGWPNGTSIGYGLTQSEIDDAVTYVGYTISPIYPMVDNNGVLSYDEVIITGIGGADVEGSDEGIWMIQDATDLGCCDPLVPQVPPDIPLKYFNLRIVTQGYFRGTSQGAYREFQ